MATSDKRRDLNRAIWAIALPSMLTNVATALFGIADLWVIGQLGLAEPQAGVELGAKFMMGLLIVFNFLRTGTIALTAQAAGRGDEEAQAATLARALGLALAIGLVLLALKPLVVPWGMELLHARGGVAREAGVYVGIRYWGGLLWLVNVALMGWLIGRRRVRAVLWTEIGSNVIHVGLDLLFVLALGWGVAGVAAATLMSEGGKTLALLAVTARQGPARTALIAAGRRETWSAARMGALLRLNRDLFLRTLLLTAAILLLTRQGARQGPLVLAANGILYQLFILSALILDGFESAAQVLCGEAVGAKDRERFDALVRALLLWGLAGGILFSLLYAVAGARFAASFSTDPAVVATTLAYVPWAVLLPVLGVSSYVFDGVYRRDLDEGDAAHDGRGLHRLCGFAGRRRRFGQSRPVAGLQPVPRGARDGTGAAAAEAEATGLRGRCFAEIDLITSRCPAAVSNGGSERATACAIRASMRGSSSASGACSWTWRTRLPSPRRMESGSGRPTPSRKCKVTQRGKTARDSTACEGFSVGPKPTARLL